MRLLVEGWRNVPHSYALVNSFQLLEIMKREDVDLFFREIPLPGNNWRLLSGLFDEEEDRRINELRIWDGEPIDAIYRISFPGDLGPPVYPGVPVFVFLTAEYQRFMPDLFVNGRSDEISGRNWLHFITPSNWSRAAFAECGRPAKVVPHGVDPNVFYPLSASERRVGRRELGFEGKFVWLNIGAMTHNKGVDLLLQVFDRVSEGNHDNVLVLKGLDDLYQSKALLERWLQVIPLERRARLKEKIVFSGASLPFTEVNKLYNFADCYVAPYRAEGFNLPVLEAAACGLCSIISAQGSTEDFTNSDFVRYIATRKVCQSGQVLLEPDLNDLEELFRQVLADSGFRERGGLMGRSHVLNNFSWEFVVDELLANINEVLRVQGALDE